MLRFSSDRRFSWSGVQTAVSQDWVQAVASQGVLPETWPETALPVRISFLPRAEVWLPARRRFQACKYYVETEDPDILILMEIKVNNEPISVNCRSFPLAVTAILLKHKAVSVDKTLPGHPDPNSVEDRIITPEFDRYHVIGTYVVDAGQNLKARSFVISL
ncbi:hypothetical protein BC826DRAFT_969069 [Russula brevipes]|nr:hypothetical protein BC826DRAFT_969069 [Russula brevipes]